MIAPRLAVLLREMRDAAQRALIFVGPRSNAEFLADELLQSAVAMSLLRLGESATKILQNYPEFAQAYPDVRWKSMRGARNIIAHAYDELDFVIIWKIVADHLPSLITTLDAVLDTPARS